MYVGKVLGVLAVFCTLVIHAVSSLPSFRKVIAWKDDVSILSFNTMTKLIVKNIGDGDIFISHISFGIKKFKKLSV